MKLSRKLTLAMIAGMSVVFTVSAWVSVYRARTFAERSLEREAQLTGHALTLALADIWRREGQARALQMIDDANEEEGPTRLRWVWLNARDDDPYAPRGPRAVLAPVALGHEVSFNDIARGEGVLRTYIPAAIESGRPGAIELTSSMESVDRYVKNTIRNAIITTIALAAICGVLAMLIGGWFVGRPIRALVAKARRVGAGDLSGRLELRQRDEIGELAEEMNAMSDRLAASKAEVELATTARIATLEQLRHADRLTTVGKLASGIAHELGTPLNVISGRARMVSGGELAEAEIRECGEIIVDQTKRMTVIIRQLLDFARRRGAHKSSQDVPQLARNTVSLLTPMADKKGITLAVKPDGKDSKDDHDDDAADLTADVDPGQLQQALTNLIVNAIQAMTKRGTITVALSHAHARPPADHAGPEGEYLRIAVSDEGQGMAADTMAHIFEPFFTTKPVGEGTGLGLSVTYGIVQEHGGWIQVDSQVEKGSTFTVYLPQPADRADNIPEAIAAEVTS